MVLFRGKLITLGELDAFVLNQRHATPTKHQLGARVKLVFRDDERNTHHLPCVVAGVHINAARSVTYDLAFRIADTELYSVVDGFREFIEPADVAIYTVVPDENQEPPTPDPAPVAKLTLVK